MSNIYTYKNYGKLFIINLFNSTQYLRDMTGCSQPSKAGFEGLLSTLKSRVMTGSTQPSKAGWNMTERKDQI